jgi:MbtH protein
MNPNMSDDEDTDQRFRVVVNDEAQYSIWPLERALPAGWGEAGMQGARAACLEHIASVWTDMRPLSLRRRQDA